MKKPLFALLSLLALAAGAMVMMSRSSESPWSTSSEEAIAEYELGVAARMKLYGDEAAKHFSRSLDHDPEFAAAIVGLLEYVGHDERDRLLASLREIESDDLQPRERFMVLYALARERGDSDRMTQLVEEFAASDPGDPYALSNCSREAWENQDWDRAEQHYRKLLEVDPNWVIAQNRLGYIAMATGRFDEAEELFETYKYIAPDQANPYDSLGELLTLIGRYDEARGALEQAIAIKADFCISYQHLVEVEVIAGRLDAAPAIVDRARRHCESEMTDRLDCQIEFWSDFLDGDFESPWSDEMAACRDLLGEASFLIHRAALLNGRDEAAQRAEAALREHVEKNHLEDNPEYKVPIAMLAHMQGVRLALEGDLDAAIASFYRADDFLVFWGDGQGVLKLYNQLNLAWALERAGNTEAAEAILELIRGVNPQFAEDSERLRVTFPVGRLLGS